MAIIYSVGLYCKYTGGSPFIFLDNKKDAELLVQILEKYSELLATNMSEDLSKEYFKIEEESLAFLKQLGIKEKHSFPTKFPESFEQFEIHEHTVYSLAPFAQNLLKEQVKNLI